jgi:hypothetical protein
VDRSSSGGWYDHAILGRQKGISTVTAACAANGPLNAHTPFPTQRTSVQPRGQQIREQHGLFAHPATEPLGRAGRRARTASVPTALLSMSSHAPHRTEAGGKEASADALPTRISASSSALPAVSLRSAAPSSPSPAVDSLSSPAPLAQPATVATSMQSIESLLASSTPSLSSLHRPNICCTAVQPPLSHLLPARRGECWSLRWPARHCRRRGRFC